MAKKLSKALKDAIIVYYIKKIVLWLAKRQTMAYMLGKMCLADWKANNGRLMFLAAVCDIYKCLRLLQTPQILVLLVLTGL